MMRGLAVMAFAILAACDVAQPIADQIARDQARSTVNDVVAQNIPGVDLSSVTDCIINIASTQEIFEIAKDSVTGMNPDTTNLILEIASRPQSVECILKSSLANL